MPQILHLRKEKKVWGAMGGPEAENTNTSAIGARHMHFHSGTQMLTVTLDDLTEHPFVSKLRVWVWTRWEEGAVKLHRAEQSRAEQFGVRRCVPSFTKVSCS